MWSVADLADAIAEGIRRANALLDAEQAVYGLDAMDEVALHPVVAEGFKIAGYGVHREQRYPADRRRGRRSEGERCDLVLTPGNSALRAPDRAATLFDDPDAVALDEAFWLEIKTARQFTVEGPNPRYSSEMLHISRKDVSKLSKDRDILHAGLVVIAFVADASVARHDLRMWYDRAIARGMPIGYPATRVVHLTDRLGNGVCGIACCPVGHL